MRNRRNIVVDQRGFTLIELVLYLVISAILFGVTAQLMRTQVDAYALMSGRQSALSDARYTLNRMASELILIRTADIISIAPDNLQFMDTGGNLTSFRLGTAGGVPTIFRGNDALLSPMQAFQINYYDQNEQPTAVLANIRKFQVNLTMAAQGTEGNLSISTMVTPRNFVYTNYQ